jgi:hypothetical protein
MSQRQISISNEDKLEWQEKFSKVRKMKFLKFT